MDPCVANISRPSSNIRRFCEADRNGSGARTKDSLQSAVISTQCPGRNAERSLKHTKLATSIAGITSALVLSGCVTGGQRQATAQPATQSARTTAVVTAPPAPRRSSVVRPVVSEEVVLEQGDVYISGASNADVVFVGGSTYIWVTQSDGQRHRHFYGHGDKRQEVFRRRDNLRSVTAHFPAHRSTRHEDGEHRRHHREDAGSTQQLHAESTHRYVQPPQHHLPVNNQAHQSAQQDQRRPKQSRTVHEASVGNSGLRHRPATNISATKA